MNAHKQNSRRHVTALARAVICLALVSTCAAVSAPHNAHASPAGAQPVSQSRFITAAQSGMFGKLTPANGATEVPTRSVTLMWSPLANAGFYEVCVGLAGNVCNVYQRTGVTETVVVLPPLPSGTVFAWQVKAATTSGPVFADNGQVWTFRTVRDPSVEPPGPFSKLTPDDGAVGVHPGAPVFSWQPAQHATHYEFCLSVNSTPCAIWLITTTTNLAQLPAALAPGATYRWQVTAINPAGRTPANFGAPWLFTTAGAGNAPGPFGKISPASDAVNQPISGLTFTWQAAPGAAAYQLCIGSAPGMCSALFSTPLTTFVTPLQFQLLPNSRYFWQVAAFNAAGQTRADGNIPWHFHTSPDAATAGLLAIYALAFDSSPDSSNPLAGYYQPTIHGIVSATIGQPARVAVVLADLDQDGDSHILVIRNGKVTPVHGLPAPATPPLTPTPTLTNAITEVDMTDPAALGAFIRWARHTFPAPRNVFSYIGHGAALFPETDIANVFGPESNAGTLSGPARPASTGSGSTGSAGEAASTGGIGILPTHIGVHPDYTDAHPRAVLSTVDLAEMMKIGTDNGAFRFDVIDIVHCFAATIEEIYPLRPYAHTVTASPSYAYFDPPMAGSLLNSLPTTQQFMPAWLMAASIVRAYDQALPADDHPRILTAIDTNSLAEIKLSWDMLSQALLDHFALNPQEARAGLYDAYTASGKYDTTLCPPQDWQLAPPDALSDMAEFVSALGQQFAQRLPAGQTILSATQYAGQALASAIITTVTRAGTPWFARNLSPAPYWSFSGAGLALYTDFQGMWISDTSYLSYQAGWYTHTRSALNPKPYAFVLTTTPYISRPVLPTWADVFHRWWATATIESAACLPAYPPALQNGELSVARALGPLTRTAYVSSPIPLQAVVEVAQATVNAQVRFSVWNEGNAIFSRTVSAGYLITGAHFIQSPAPWTPTAAGVYTIEIRIDPDDRIRETNELDNARGATVIALDTAIDGRPVISGRIAGDMQWVAGPTVTLAIFQQNLSLSEPLNRLLIQAYRFVTQANTLALAPRLATTIEVLSPALPVVTVTLPAGIGRGPLALHVWAENNAGRSAQPAILWLNITPPGEPIGAGEEHYYLLRADSGDSFRIRLDTPPNEDASLFAWRPYNLTAPDWAGVNPGGDTLEVQASIPGLYLVSVRGETQGWTTYTLTLSPGPAMTASSQVMSAQSRSTPAAGDASTPALSARVNMQTEAVLPARRPLVKEPGPEIAQSAMHTLFLPLARRP